MLENALADRDIAGKRGSEQLITSEVLYQLSYVGECPANQTVVASWLAAALRSWPMLWAHPRLRPGRNPGPWAHPARLLAGVFRWSESSDIASTLASQYGCVSAIGVSPS